MAAVVNFFTDLFSTKAETFKEKLINQIKDIERWEKSESLYLFYNDTFHWWLFPINEPSLKHGDKYQLDQKTMEELKKDKDYIPYYKKGLSMCFRLWGWRLEEKEIDANYFKTQRIGCFYRELNLCKAIKSTSFFGLDKERESLIAFASHVVKGDFLLNEYTSYLSAIVNSVASFETEVKINSTKERSVQEDRLIDIKQNLENTLRRLRSWHGKENHSKFYDAYIDAWLFPSDKTCPIHGDRYKLDQVLASRLNEDAEFKRNLKEGCELALKFWGWNPEAQQNSKSNSIQSCLMKSAFKTSNSLERAIYCFEKMFPDAESGGMLQAIKEVYRRTRNLGEFGMKSKLELEKSEKNSSSSMEIENALSNKKQEHEDVPGFVYKFQRLHLEKLKAINDIKSLEGFLSLDENKWIRNHQGQKILILGVDSPALDKIQVDILKSNKSYLDEVKHTVHLVGEIMRWNVKKKGFEATSVFSDFGGDTIYYLFWLCNTCNNLGLVPEFESLTSLGFTLVEKQTSSFLNKTIPLRNYFIDQQDAIKNKEFPSKFRAATLSEKQLVVKEKNLKQREEFEFWRKFKSWHKFHSSHFDWWAFPIDESSLVCGDTFRLTQSDIEILKADNLFIESLKYCLESISLSWGWNIKEQRLIENKHPDQAWNYWGVRLYKAAKSACLFDLQMEHSSLVWFGVLLLKNGYQLKYGEKDYTSFFIKWAEGLKII